MKDPNDIADEFERRRRAQRGERMGAQMEGARMLQELVKTWDGLEGRYFGTILDISTREGLCVEVRQGDTVVAKWTRDGTTLFFNVDGEAAQTADSVEGAMHVTMAFVKDGPPPRPSKIGYV